MPSLRQQTLVTTGLQQRFEELEADVNLLLPAAACRANGSARKMEHHALWSFDRCQKANAGSEQRKVQDSAVLRHPLGTKEPPRIMDVRGDLRRSVKAPRFMGTQTPSQ